MVTLQRTFCRAPRELGQLALTSAKTFGVPISLAGASSDFST